MSQTEAIMSQHDAILSRLEELNAIGIALSSESDINRLLETILLAAMRITHADAGTLYLLDSDKQELTFEIMRTNSLGKAFGGTSGQPIPASVPPIQLYKDGKPNHSMVAAHAALSGTSINIPDAYKAEGFDFTGTKGFDKKNGYRSTSFLAVPMRNHKNKIIGVVQLINAMDSATGAIVAFSCQEQSMLESLMQQYNVRLNQLEELNAIGIALSSERDINRLLETILLVAMRITDADAGTLYLLDSDKQELTFEIMRTNSLGKAFGGTSGQPIPASVFPIQLYKDGKPNHSMVAAHAALSGTSINIPDAYKAEGFDFTGTKGFDKTSGYRSTSFLAVPMRNHDNEIIGVVQLINSMDRGTGAIVAFSRQEQSLLESLSSQAAISLTNRRLTQQMVDLFESFISLINAAIDDKSPYTGGHCERVPALTMMLADAVNRTKQGPLKDFEMTEKDRYELKIAGLLHDCGKITTPVHVVDKSTKLETIFDRIHLIDTRFELLKRDAEITMLRTLSKISSPANGESEARGAQQRSEAEGAGEGGSGGEGETTAIHAEYNARIKQLDDDREFLRHCNIGSEKMDEAHQQRVQQIAAYTWRNEAGEQVNFLNANEIENLTIRAGTLTAAERQIINHHIDVTIKMLEALPWPKHLTKVPEYAGGHHERMDGKGYPRGLKREQMSVQARVMGIADIFEALTAADRPYKRGKTLTESLHILGKFKENGHIDPDLFDVFVREKVYLEYAKQFLGQEQIDTVDESLIPGYTS